MLTILLGKVTIQLYFQILHLEQIKIQFMKNPNGHKVK
jgi:hypothetical protein